MEVEGVTDQLQVWHYGLVARWWAEFNTDGPEIDCFRKLIERYGEPALDVSCGTGWLLIPFLRAGLDIDGSDISPDMLDLCSQKARREGLTARLYHQPMHDLALPRKYKTIVVCGGFGLGGSRHQDQEALRRFFHHLEPGGALLLDNYLPYKDADEWRYWVKEERRRLPSPWPPTGGRRQAESGEEIELRSRLAALDPLDQAALRRVVPNHAHPPKAMPVNRALALAGTLATGRRTSALRGRGAAAKGRSAIPILTSRRWANIKAIKSVISSSVRTSQ